MSAAHTLNDPRAAQDLREELKRVMDAGEKEAMLHEADKILMLAALNAGDANRFCEFAPEIVDYARAPKGPMGMRQYAHAPTRRPLLHEVVQELLLPDTFEQPGLSELVQLALNAASGRFGRDALREQANELLGSWGAMYAEQQAERRKGMAA